MQEGQRIYLPRFSSKNNKDDDNRLKKYRFKKIWRTRGHSRRVEK